MRLINAEYLCDYANNTVDKTVDANDIMRMPYIEAVPLRPLAKWLAGYAAAPGTVGKMCYDDVRADLEANEHWWEKFLRGMDWEANDADD